MTFLPTLRPRLLPGPALPCILHISELLLYMTGGPDHGHQKIEHEPVQEVKNDD